MQVKAFNDLEDAFGWLKIAPPYKTDADWRLSDTALASQSRSVKRSPTLSAKNLALHPFAWVRTGLNLWRNREESTKSHLLPTGGVHPAARVEVFVCAGIPVWRRREVDAVEQAEGEAGKSGRGEGAS